MKRWLDKQVKITDDIQHQFFILPARLVGFILARKQKHLKL
jgi:hypothetical protein